MPTDRKPSPILSVGRVVMVLLGLYVGAYYWMVERTFKLDWPAATTTYFAEYPPVAEYWTESYEINSASDVSFRRWSRFFAPIHSLDRRIRPHVWEPE
jgi:hypothetical protein